MGRRLGQHFLSNPAILRRIAEAVCPEPCPLVVEIGPGKGSLTRRLLERADRVVAIEVDPSLASRLSALSNRLEVVENDVLAVDLAQWGPAVFTGNLPYYITSPILDKTLTLGAICRHAVYMLQKEVAARLTASSGSRAYGFLSVSVQSRAHVEHLFSVRAASFFPPPKVDSAVVKLVPTSPIIQPVEPFLTFVSRCFHQKRKTLRNNLAPYYDERRISSLPEAHLRAEQLSLQDLAKLYRCLEEFVSDP